MLLVTRSVLEGELRVLGTSGKQDRAPTAPVSIVALVGTGWCWAWGRFL